MATIREIIGSGSFLGFDLTFGVIKAGYDDCTEPAGAFITLGFVIAAVQKIPQHC